MKIVKYAIVFLFSVGLMGCGKDNDDKVDVTKPTIVLNSPTNSTNLNPGSVLNVNAVLSDNEKVQEYVVKIYAGGETKSVKNVEEFYFNSFTDTDAYGNAVPVLTGKEISLSFDIAITDNARVGFYTFSISVKDQAGNATEEKVHFEIIRP